MDDALSALVWQRATAACEYPAFRRQGLARRATAALARRLLGSVDSVGLNVHAENEAAITCYRGLGFEAAAAYEEASLTRIAAPP